MQNFRSTSLPLETRVEALMTELTNEEKIGFIDYRNAGVPRLGIPPYSWWNEALHGLARSGTATVFPQAIAMAATFDPAQITAMGEIIATETRARYFSASALGDHDTYKGLTQWSPNINIFRDPRWGRGHETYGECPFLTSQLGMAFTRACQGDDPATKLRVCATPKHFAVHSGPEGGRANFDAVVDERDLRETYLPAFKACVVEARAESVMSAYNAINGEPCSTNKRLLADILRGEWGFKGAVVTDVGVLRNLVHKHKTQADSAAGLKAELEAGVDVISDFLAPDEVADAWRRGFISQEALDTAVRNQLRIKFKLGMFDEAPQDTPPYEVIACDAHRAVSLEAARRSIVLLKNENSFLPFDATKIRRLAVVGPNADSFQSLLGNYAGTPLDPITPLRGILREAETNGIRVFYAKGSHYHAPKIEGCSNYEDDGHSEALAAAAASDAVVAVCGLCPDMEGEEGDATNFNPAGDKQTLDLPATQLALIAKLYATGKPVVLVNVSGSAIAIPDEAAKASLQIFYPGEFGGQALAEILFGKFNPCGRLPVTFYRTSDDLPPFTDYAMAGRTYRFFDGDVLYPFGHGLSYTRFEYSDLYVNSTTARVTVTNTGTLAGEHSVLLFVSLPDAKTRVPRKQLAAIGRVSLAPNASETLTLPIWQNALRAVLPDGTETNDVGKTLVQVGDLTVVM